MKPPDCVMKGMVNEKPLHEKKISELEDQVCKDHSHTLGIGELKEWAKRLDKLEKLFEKQDDGFREHNIELLKKMKEGLK